MVAVGRYGAPAFLHLRMCKYYSVLSCSIQCLHGLQLMMKTSLDTSERSQNENGLKQVMTILEFGDEWMNALNAT